MTPWHFTLACILGMVHATAVLAAGPALNIVTELSQPSVMLQGGALIGHETDKVQSLMQQAGLTHVITPLPWARAFALVRTQGATCVFPTTRTPQREAMFKWIGPLRRTQWVAYGLAGPQPVARTIDQARSLRIGTYNGDVRAEVLGAEGYTVDAAGEDSMNAQKLLRGRVDLWVTGQRYADLYLKRRGLTKKIVALFTFHQVEQYLACNTGLDDTLVRRMNDVAARMRQSGELDAIERKYEHWSAPD